MLDIHCSQPLLWRWHVSGWLCYSIVLFRSNVKLLNVNLKDHDKHPINAGDEWSDCMQQTLIYLLAVVNAVARVTDARENRCCTASPAQCMSWHHLSSGRKSRYHDQYVSAELMELAEARSTFDLHAILRVYIDDWETIHHGVLIDRKQSWIRTSDNRSNLNAVTMSHMKTSHRVIIILGRGCWEWCNNTTELAVLRLIDGNVN